MLIWNVPIAQECPSGSDPMNGNSELLFSFTVYFKPDAPFNGYSQDTAMSKGSTALGAAPVTTKKDIVLVLQASTEISVSVKA
jgi:hypothetical protein